MITHSPQLMIVYNPSGWNPLVRVGWVSCSDFWVRLQNCRVMRRFGGHAQIAKLAQSGPIAATELLDLSKEESCSVVLCSRVVPCNVAAWIEQCPIPKGMEELAIEMIEAETPHDKLPPAYDAAVASRGRKKAAR